MLVVSTYWFLMMYRYFSMPQLHVTKFHEWTSCLSRIKEIYPKQDACAKNKVLTEKHLINGLK